MATGYSVYCPGTSVSTYSGKWTGTVTTWAWEYEDHVTVRIRFYTTQNHLNSKVQGTDYFYGSAVINGNAYDFKIAYLGYPGVNSSDSFEKEVKIYFDGSGKADLTFAVTVQGAAGTYLQGYSLSASLSHTFSNAAKAGTVELSPSARRMGDTALLAVKGGAGTVQYRLSYEFGSLSGTIAQEQMLAENAALLEKQWVIPDLLEGCPDAAGGRLTVVCETYRFGTYIGTSRVTREIEAYPAATLEEGGTLRIGFPFAFSIRRPSSRYTTNLRYRLLGNEGNIAEGITEDAYTWEIPLSLGKKMPASQGETIYIFCDTYHGTALVGTNSYQWDITANPAQSVYRPVIDSVRIRKYVPQGGDRFENLLLQNVSCVDIAVEAHSDSSELDTYTFKGFGRTVTLEAEDFGGFTGIAANAASGDHTVSVTVTDRRGNSESNYYTLSVLPYNKPKVIPYSDGSVSYAEPICFRADREGMASGAGSYLRILAGRRFTRILSGGEERNGARMEYRVRRTGEDWPEEYVLLLSREEPEDLVSRNLEGVFPDPDASYQAELKVTDLVGFSHSYLVKLSSQKVNFSLLCAADGAAFGKTAEFPGVVEIAQDMTLWVRGDLKVDGGLWKELPSADNASAWESGFPRGVCGVSGCFYRVDQGNRVAVAFNRAIRWAGTGIVLNTAPLPPSERPGSPVSRICPAEDGFVLATVGTDGYITVDLAWSSRSAAQYNWIDGFVDYWKEDA